MLTHHLQEALYTHYAVCLLTSSQHIYALLTVSQERTARLGEDEGERPSLLSQGPGPYQHGTVLNVERIRGVSALKWAD